MSGPIVVTLEAEWHDYASPYAHRKARSYRLVTGPTDHVLARVWQSAEVEGEWYATTGFGARYLPSRQEAMAWCEKQYGSTA